MKSMLSVVMLSGIFSLLSASLFIILHAPDVALTEAAVGAVIVSILFFSALAITGKHQMLTRKNHFVSIFVVLVTGAGLLYSTTDMPPFGDPNAPVQQHVAPFYLTETEKQIGIPNVVTAVLASYRGFDTFGEVVVVFTALIAVLLLIGKDNRPSE
jgi:multicomponent Na+:H+ antiporter subunit B